MQRSILLPEKEVSLWSPGGHRSKTPGLGKKSIISCIGWNSAACENTSWLWQVMTSSYVKIRTKTNQVDFDARATLSSDTVKD